MSRFEDTLHRDLTVIADRATPSPDAWATIRQRIAEQDPIQETEIIMLTENTTTTRRWPLVAAAAAVVAVVVGAIAFVGTDDEVPADDPTPTVAPTPPPDDETAPVDDVDAEDADADPAPDADPAVVETDEPADDDPADPAEVAPLPQTISLTGTTEGVVEFDQGTGSYTARETVAGDATGTGTASGTAALNAAGDGLDGAGRRVLDVTIDGVGSGSLVIDDRWSSTFDGATETSGTIVGGTGDFAGATGTWQGSFAVGSNDLETVPIETGGPFTMELELPAEGEVAADLLIGGEGRTLAAGTYTTDSLGTPLTFDLGEPAQGTWGVAAWQGGVWIYRGNADEFIQLTRVGGWYDAEEARDPATNGRASFGAADLDAWIENAEDIRITDLGDVTVGGRPARLIEFGVDPSSDAGEGICEPENQPCVWYFERSADDLRTDGGRGNSMWAGREARAYVVDVEGYEPILVEGSTTLDDQQSWLDEVFQPLVDSMVIGEPAPTVPGGIGRATIRVTATGTGTDEPSATETRDDSGTVNRTFVTRYDGDAVGLGEGFTTRTPLENEPWTQGRGTITFDGQVAGLGTGTFTIEQIDFLTSTYFAVGAITGGTGDFAGASGTVRFDPNAYTFEIEVPRRPVEVGEVFELTASWTDGEIAEAAGADGTPLTTGVTTFSGQLSGRAPWTSTGAVTENTVTTGSVVQVFSGSIEGVGSGTLTMRDESRADQNGRWVNAALITGGTGDFRGASGWMLGASEDGAATGTSEIELRLPAG